MGRRQVAELSYLQQYVSFTGPYFRLEAAIQRELEVDIQSLDRLEKGVPIFPTSVPAVTRVYLSQAKAEH